MPRYTVKMPLKSDRLRKSPENDGLAGEAYVIVRERILRGELAIGQVISRRKVAAELGMSFLPVSEALLRLEHEGLLESRPRAGTRVRVPTRQDVQGHYIVREALEAQAAMLFAGQATRDERSELLRLAIRVDALSIQTTGNRFVYLSLHEKLHRRIAECARCAALSDAISRTSALASTWLCATRASSSDNPPHHHEELMKVLLEGDPSAAAEAMRGHIRSSMENTLLRLEPYFRLQQAHPQTYSRTPKKHISLESLMAESVSATAAY
jgi:DNA-binding GntR family transcriptional regulator